MSEPALVAVLIDVPLGADGEIIRQVQPLSGNIGILQGYKTCLRLLLCFSDDLLSLGLE